MSVVNKKKQIRKLFFTVSPFKILKDAHIVIRSPSGDTDIIVIDISLLNSDYTFIENGTGKNRNCFQIGKIKINEQERKALIGFYAIT